MAADAGLERRLYASGPFTLAAWMGTGRSGPLTVYIEGDGYAWETRGRPSPDPTPRNPVALRLAARDGGGRVLYLARPCQYTGGNAAPGCGTRHWTSHRFAPDIVDAMDRAIDMAKRECGAERLVLVGYSGGAAIAALLAARRGDVAGLATVAGILDHAAWTRLHGVTPLTGSLDPADVIDGLRGLPQRHVAGGDDTVVPPTLIENAAQRAGGPLLVLPGLGHQGDWAAGWPAIRRDLP